MSQRNTSTLAFSIWRENNAGIMLPYSRTQSEADHLGLIFMAMAGYKPTSTGILERMAQGKQGGSPPEFFTHPSDQTRIGRLLLDSRSVK
jgi:predicted Zn-dependent protease